MENISLNQTVILQKGNIIKALKLVPGKFVVFERLKFKPDNAAGHPFGTVFNVQGMHLHPVTDIVKKEINVSAGEDNRNLIDTYGKSQALKRTDLLQLKEEGATGEEIVKSLVENSSSFSKKTVFSQKKYLKKKEKKYFSYIKILKPTARLICKVYQEGKPSKICHMRIESMSQLLATTNIRSGSKVAVLETCSGVLLGMILERLGGKGSVVNLHVGETPANLFAVSHFNFPDSYWDNLHSLPLHKLAPILASHTFESTFPHLENSKNVDTVTINNSNLDAAATLEPDAHLSDSNSMVDEDVQISSRKRKHSLTSEEKSAIRAARQQKRYDHQKRAWDLLTDKNMDALIVSSKYHPTPILLLLLDCLALSKPFVVYSEYKEPLMELFVHLTTKNVAINLQITETFLRQYQVLPERTHPHVMMPGNTGYLLTGIKVERS